MQDLFGGKPISGGIESNSGSKYRLLPKAEYPLVCADLLIKETRDGRPYISADFEVIEGPYVGVVFHDMFMADDSEGALKALAKIRKWVEIVGIVYDPAKPVTVEILEQLVDKEFVAGVWVQKSNNEKYKDQNRIAYFKGEVEKVAKPEAKSTKKVDFDEEIPF